MFDVEIDLDKFIIPKGKTDLLSSLKRLDKKLLKEKLEENGCENAKELKDYLIEMFESSLDMSYDDKNTEAFLRV